MQIRCYMFGGFCVGICESYLDDKCTTELPVCWFHYAVKKNAQVILMSQRCLLLLSTSALTA